MCGIIQTTYIRISEVSFDSSKSQTIDILRNIHEKTFFETTMVSFKKIFVVNNLAGNIYNPPIF
jgi:hypothetical protein